jgi:hypothetical protein
MTADVTAAFEGTSYTITLPHAAMRPVFCIASLVVAAACIVAARRGRIFMPLGALIGAAVGAALVYGFTSAPYLSTGTMFADAYLDAAIAAACGGAALGTAALAIALSPRGDGAERRARIATAVAAVTVATGLATAAIAIRQRLVLGPRSTELPLVMRTGRWRGHAGFTHDVRAVFGRPGWTGFFRTTFSPIELTSEDAGARGFLCDDCEQKVHPTTAGATGVVVHAHVRRVRIERRLEFDALVEKGNPLWPLRVGERHVFAIQSSPRESTGGWATAIADGARSLVPHATGGPTVERHQEELFVARTVMKGGLRHFVIEVSQPDEPPATIEVYALDGETWVAHDDGDDSRERLFEPRAVPTEGAYYCSVARLPFTICNAGGDSHFKVMGPIGGNISGDSGLQGLAVTLLTLGAVAPGRGPESHYCLESAEPGAGDEMPVANEPPPDTRQTAVDPGLTEYATCAKTKANAKPSR